MNSIKNIGKIGAIWFAIFSGAWVILEPFGGMNLLKKYGSNIVFLYVIIALISFMLALLAFLLNYKNTNQEGNIDPLEIELSRTQYDYLKLLSKTEESIYLLGLSLPTFALESKIEFLRSKIQEGILVRIILLNPYSPATHERPDKIYHVTTKISETCINTLAVLLKLKNNGISETQKNLLKIKLINIHPSIGVIGNEKQIFWSPYLSLYTGAKSPYVIHNLNQSKFGSEIRKHFEMLWSEYSIEINNTTTIDDLKKFVILEGLKPVNLENSLINKLTISLGGYTNE